MTHGEIGVQLLETARGILGNIKVPVACLSVSTEARIETIRTQAGHLLEKLSQSSKNTGVLVLTDLCGATPHNVIHQIDFEPKALVSGLNLPMLLRALNYAVEDSLEILAEKAQKGGHTGITLAHSVSDEINTRKVTNKLPLFN